LQTKLKEEWRNITGRIAKMYYVILSDTIATVYVAAERNIY